VEPVRYHPEMTAGASLLELRRTERYWVHEPIARGGMAQVHIGVVEGALGFSRVVAIKRLHSPLASDARFVSMLIDEARIVSRIRHVNVVPTLDILEVAGEVFVIMEYVRGASLARLLDLTYARGELVPLRIALAIVVGALRGLDAAHEATDYDGTPLGVVHRDISPQNLLVGVGGVPRVIDFGVARALGKTVSTRAGEFKGKLSYAAPEQLGDGKATPRTDVYACGIVLWELVTGQRLFQAETDVDTYRKAMRAEVPLPATLLASDDRMRAFRSPADVQALTPALMRSLEREPAARFASAADMADAMEAALPCAATHDVGLWVERLAETELADELAIVRRAEEEIARRPRRGTMPSLPGPTSERSLPLPVAPPAPPRIETARTRHFLIGLPPTTLVAIALAAAAGAGLGTMIFAWQMLGP
jgi:eukaryotic-like serine/threonine-protein kinase